MDHAQDRAVVCRSVEQTTAGVLQLRFRCAAISAFLAKDRIRRCTSMSNIVCSLLESNAKLFWLHTRYHSLAVPRATFSLPFPFPSHHRHVTTATTCYLILTIAAALPHTLQTTLLQNWPRPRLWQFWQSTVCCRTSKWTPRARRL